MNSKILILILSSRGFTSQLQGQKPVNYTNQKEYWKALGLYNDRPGRNTYTRSEFKSIWNMDNRIFRGNFKTLKE